MVTRVLAVGAIALLAYGIYRISYGYRRRREQEKPEEKSLLDEEEGDSKQVQFGKKEATHLSTSRAQSGSGGGISRGRARAKDPETKDIREVPPPAPTLQSRVSRTDSSEFKGEAIYLEVTAGQSVGLRFLLKVVQGASNNITIGRVPQNDLTLNDPEVSGKHAFVSWHAKSGTWQITDMGSLNGTQINGHSINGQNRTRGQAHALSNGDVITLGSSSRMSVKITTNHSSLHMKAVAAPFGVGVRSDPMKSKRGGKQLPMEDVSVCLWPLGDLKEFGIFCIFDGHCGRQAADDASRILPAKVTELLNDPKTRSTVLESKDAASVLQEAFRHTEAAIKYEDQGCTATALLIWRDGSRGGLCAQCANVGDSACVFSFGGRSVPMTEDHRVNTPHERERLAKSGHPVEESANRLCGMNVARVLGDKFLKNQDVGLSPEPYISQVISIDFDGDVTAVMASDGLWDIMTAKRALQVTAEASQALPTLADSKMTPAEAMAESLLEKARAARTTDNTTVMVLDFRQYGKMMQFETLRSFSEREGREG